MARPTRKTRAALLAAQMTSLSERMESVSEAMRKTAHLMAEAAATLIAFSTATAGTTELSSTSAR